MVIHCNGNIPRDTRHNFRVIKLDLKAKGYPYQETKYFVNYYFNMSLKQYDKLFQSNQPITCISTPSSSGYNPTINIFFELLNSRYSKNLSFIDSNTYLNPVFNQEAKHNTAFHKKINLPITISEKYPDSLFQLKQNIPENSKLILLEDWMSTGDTSILFSKFLSNNNIKITDYAALVVNTPYFISNTDIRRNIEKVKPFTDDLKGLCQSFITLFDGFLQNKFYRFELEFHRLNKDSYTHYLDNVLKSGSDNYLKSNLFNLNEINRKSEQLYQLLNFREERGLQ